MARILLGVSGGIAAYKACEVCRLLVRAGHDVIPLVTPGAERFVTAETFRALARRPPADDLYLHLTRADLLLVASELCANAVRHSSGAPASCMLRAWSDADAVVVEVEDDGVGFELPEFRDEADLPAPELEQGRNAADEGERALLEHELLGLQLPIDLGKHLLDQAILRQFLPETPQCAVIWRTVVEAQTNEAAEREAIGNRSLQGRIGQSMPYPEQQTSQQNLRRIAAVAGPGTAALAKQRSKRHPVHHRGKLV